VFARNRQSRKLLHSERGVRDTMRSAGLMTVLDSVDICPALEKLAEDREDTRTYERRYCDKLLGSKLESPVVAALDQ
jgi:hypothetical protein